MRSAVSGPSAAPRLLKRATVQELHHAIERILRGSSKVKDVHSIGMCQPTGQLGLSFKSSHGVLIDRLGAKQFDRGWTTATTRAAHGRRHPCRLCRPLLATCIDQADSLPATSRPSMTIQLAAPSKRATQPASMPKRIHSAINGYCIGDVLFGDLDFGSHTHRVGGQPFPCTDHLAPAIVPVRLEMTPCCGFHFLCDPPRSPGRPVRSAAARQPRLKRLATYCDQRRDHEFRSAGSIVSWVAGQQPARLATARQIGFR